MAIIVSNITRLGDVGIILRVSQGNFDCATNQQIEFDM